MPWYEEEEDYYDAIDVEAQKLRREAEEEAALERYLWEHDYD